MASTPTDLFENVTEADPEIDTKKVEAIRQAIARGEFEIDYEQLTRKMIAFETELETDQKDTKIPDTVQ